MVPIVFESRDFVVVDKPTGVLTVPSRMGKQDPRPVLGMILQEQIGQILYPIHRLDLEVSGLVLFAKNAKAHGIANVWFEKRLIEKYYEAVTLKQDFSHWPSHIPTDKTELDLSKQKEFFWTCCLIRGKKRAYESPQGQKSETRVQLLKSEDGKLFWRVQPLTGRSHQIRYEMSRHGFPILGDKLYGSIATFSDSAIALRAVELNLGKIQNDHGLEILPQLKLN